MEFKIPHKYEVVYNKGETITLAYRFAHTHTVCVAPHTPHPPPYTTRTRTNDRFLF